MRQAAELMADLDRRTSRRPPGPSGSEHWCAKCGQTFTGLGLFDAHQDVDYTRPNADVVRCRDPRSLGLVQDARGTWGTRAGLAARERAAGQLARARVGATPA